MSFFGSLVLMFSIINIEKVFGFLQWDQIHFFSLTWQQQIFNNSYIFLFFFWIPFFFGFLIKISYLPFHIWKPEMYKGLSFFSVFFFMTIYFFLLILLIIYIFFFKLSVFINIWYIYIYTITILMSTVLIFSIFDLTNIKPFLAYGTLIHLTFILIGLENLI